MLSFELSCNSRSRLETITNIADFSLLNSCIKYILAIVEKYN